jgi:hypothetical protein
MSDKLISNLEEKPILADTDAIVVEGGGATWKSSISKFKEYVFGFFGITSSTEPSDYVIVKKLTGEVYKVTLDNLLPAGVVKTAMYADSTSATSGITANKLAPGSVTHPKLAIDAVHTHNIADAEAVSQANYGTSNFGTGITTSKIVDGAVTGPKGGVPVGAVFYFAGNSAPSGYLVCNGNTIPAFDSANPGAVYSPLEESVPVWQLQGLRTQLASQFGGYGKLPDLRGLFVRGLGVNGTYTARTLVKKDFANTSGIVFWGTAENTTERAGTVSYTIEYYSDANYVVKTEEAGFTKAQAAAFATPYQITGKVNKYYLIYANRGATSAGAGVVQAESAKQHYHSAPDPGHAHPVSGGGASGTFVTSLNVTYKENTDTGGGGKRIRDVSGNTGSVSYSSPSADSATTGIVVGRHPDFAVGSVDETRPVNLALLPCIKY